MKTFQPAPGAGTADPAYRGLFKIGALAAMIAALFFRRNLDAEWMLLRNAGLFHLGPPAIPGAIQEWFMLLHQYPLLGLTLLNLFDLVNFILVGFIFLALYAALRQVSRSFMTLAAALSFLGIAVYLASNQAIGLLSLSSRYAAATTDIQKAEILAAGQAALAVHNNAHFAGGLYLGFLLVTTAGLIIALVMARSKIFKRSTAIMGIAANILGLGYYPVLIVAPKLVFIPLSLSAPFLLAWYLLIARQLWII